METSGGNPINHPRNVDAEKSSSSEDVTKGRRQHPASLVLITKKQLDYWNLISGRGTECVIKIMICRTRECGSGSTPP